MSIQLQGADGAVYIADTDEQAQQAVASGKFTIIPDAQKEVNPQAQVKTAPQATPQPVVEPRQFDISDVNSNEQTADNSAPSNPAPPQEPTTPEQTTPPEPAPIKQPTPDEVTERTSKNLIGLDGSIYYSPDVDATKRALRTGQFRIATLDEENEAGIQKRVGDIARSTSGIGAFFDSLRSELPGVATLDELHRNSLTPDQREALDLYNQEVEEQHRGAKAAGSIIGGAVTAYIGGKIAKEVEGALGLAEEVPLLSGKGIAKVVNEATIYGADSVGKKIVDKDYPGAAAEAAASLFGVAAIHSVGSGFKSAIEGAGKFLEGPAVDEVSTELERQQGLNAIGKAIGMTPKQIAEYGPKIKPMLDAAGVTEAEAASGNPDIILPKIQALEESGPAIGKAIKELDSFKEKAPIIQDSLDSTREQIRKLLPVEALERESATEQLAQAKVALKEAESLDERLKARESQSEAQSKLEELGKPAPLEKQAVRALQPILDQIEASAKKGTFAETQALKKFIGGQTNWNGDNSYINILRKRASSIVKEGIISAEDKVATELGSSEIKKGLDESRAAYTYSKIFGDTADRLSAKQVPQSELKELLSLSRGHGSLPILALHAIGVPGPISGAAGLAIGPLKSYLDKQAFARGVRAVYRDSATPATDLTLHALEKQTTRISGEVSKFISALSSKVAQSAVPKFKTPTEFLPDGGVGKSEKQQMSSLRKLVDSNLNNPETFASNVSVITDPMRKEGLNDLADQYTDHQLRLLKVIDTLIEKDDSLKSAHPFSSNVTIDEISPIAKAKYSKALAIAADPLTLLSLIKSNTITQGDVAIAAATNPATLQKMRDAAVDEALKSKPDLSYQQRLNMGIFMGTNIDESTEQIPVLQSIYPAPGPIGGAPPGGKQGKTKSSGTGGKSIADNYLSTSERAAGHGQ